MGRKIKAIVEIDEKGKLLSYHESSREAALLAGINPGIISHILNGFRKTYHGRRWRRATDTEIAFWGAINDHLDQVIERRKQGPESVAGEQLPEAPTEFMPPVTDNPMAEDGLTPFERMLKRKKN